jgi:hypothetical protein
MNDGHYIIPFSTDASLSALPCSLSRERGSHDLDLADDSSREPALNSRRA